MSVCIKAVLTPEARYQADGGKPKRQTSGAAGLDLRASAPSAELPWQTRSSQQHTLHRLPKGALRLFPGQRALIPTGVRLAIPKGYEGQIRPRSGLAWAAGVTVLNGPGTLDADFRGVVRVILINHGMVPVDIHPGDRIAQVVFARVESPSIAVVDALDETERGAGGIGSTGVSS